MAFRVMPATGLEVDEVTVVTDANSYSEVADFLAYFLDRNVDYSDKEPEDLQAALLAATDYVEARYGARFGGVKLNNSQSLSWPRRNARDREGYIIEGIPVLLKRAIWEYAARALTSALLPDPSNDRAVSVTSTTIGPIKEYTSYFSNASVFKRYPLADSWIAHLLVGGSGGTIR